MRIEDALGVPRRARRVAKPGRGALVEFGPAEVAVGLGEPCFIGDRVAQPGCGHMRGIGQHDVAFDRRQLVGERLEQRHEGQVGEYDAILGVIDDPGDLFREKPGIDRVVDRAEADDRIPGLQMPVAIPGERGDAVAEADAVAREALRACERAIAQLLVVAAMHRPFDGPRDDLASWMLDRREIDHLVQQQRPILHQPEHRLPPPFRSSAPGGDKNVTNAGLCA